MDSEEILKALNIRYVDLRFVLKFPEACEVPEDKVSALRGGMGQMLLRQNCIRDQKCENCDFEDECLVRRMMYAKYEKDFQPAFASRGDSNGYLIECENKEEYFGAGEQLEFHLVLFGKVIVYFTQFLQALYMLGQAGLGKEHARYEIVWVEDEMGERIVDGTQVDLRRLCVCRIREYAERRVNQLKKKDRKNMLVFQTPTSIKHEGKFIRQFSAEALLRSLTRRIYCLDLFEALEGTEKLLLDDDLPEIVFQKNVLAEITRYSSTQDEKMKLRGIKGKVRFDELSDELLLLFAAGEKLHIGKNTSFGFGKYIIL